MINFDLVLYYIKKSLSNPKQYSKVTEYVIIEENDNFIQNIKKIEQKPNFVKWSTASNYIIENTLKTL